MFFFNLLFANFASCHGDGNIPSGEAPVKIAIIADESLREYADILTVELSKDKDLVLLERSKIDKIFKEQQISVENLGAKSIELGKLLGADGLIILKKINFDKKEFVVSRLVAVNTGVILGATFQPFPPEKSDEWLKGIQTRFLLLLPKLKVQSKDSVPISILNIRAPIDTSELKLLEKEFTLALAFRLVQEKEIFVLERWKMEKLDWEKDLGSAENNPFWTGSYLLDGSIELVGDDSIKVVVRLRKPSGEELRLEETGKKDKLNEVTDRLTKKILQELGKSSENISWDTKAEAE